MKLAISVLLSLSPLLAQSQTAALSGRVVDPSGAAVSNVVVALRGSQTSGTFSVTTDLRGSYSFPRLAPGSYSLSVESAGFETFERAGLELAGGAALRVDVNLKLGRVAQQVTVSAKAPDFIETLSVRDVKESAAKDVGEAVAALDGIAKIRKGGIANDLIVRGFSQSNLNVLVDGARIYGACPNRMDPAAFHVDFAEVDQVEVTKGAFDVRNQGSLGGMVNIVSRRPEAGFEFVPSFGTGSFGYFNPSATLSWAGEKTFATAGYSFRTSEPFRDGVGKPFTAYANYRAASQNLSAFTIDTGWARVGFAPAKGQQLTFAFTRQQADNVLYPYLQMDSGSDASDRTTASYEKTTATGPFQALRADAYFTRVDHLMDDALRTSSLTAARPYSMSAAAATRVLGGRVEGDIAGLTAGFETYRRNWDVTNTMLMSGSYMPQHALPNVNLWSGGLYTLYRRSFRLLTLSAGARLDAAHTAAAPDMMVTNLYLAYNATAPLSQTDLNPSGNVRMVYRLPVGFELFAGAGSTVRVPDPEERYYALKRMGASWVGNPSLRPTRNTETDLGFNYRSGRLSLRPTLFYSVLSDYVVVNNDLTARSYQNVDAKMYGGELGYSLALTRRLALMGGVSMARGVKTPKPAAGIFNRNLAEIPPLRTRAALRYGDRRFFAQFETLAAAAQNRVDTDLHELPTPGWTIFNLKAGIHTKRLNLAGGMENLLNRFYYESASYQRDPFRLGIKVPEPGRTLYLSASYGF